MCWGTTPASVARRRIDEVVLGAGSDRSLEALAGVFLALLEGMEGQLGQAQDRMKAGRRGLAEVGLHNWVKHTGLLEGQLAMLAADFSLAERVLREVLGMPGASADRWFSTFAGAELARATHAQGRHDDALVLMDATESRPTPVDIYIRTRCCGARALALGSIGRVDEAEALAREAVELARGTDCLNLRGDTLVDLAEILSLAGRPAEAAAALAEAVALYERKGNVVSAARASAQLQAIG
jgi:tetratricopeptide (TPR) repeat protein